MFGRQFTAPVVIKVDSPLAQPVLQGLADFRLDLQAGRTVQFIQRLCAGLSMETLRHKAINPGGQHNCLDTNVPEVWCQIGHLGSTTSREQQDQRSAEFGLQTAAAFVQAGQQLPALGIPGRLPGTPVNPQPMRTHLHPLGDREQRLKGDLRHVFRVRDRGGQQGPLLRRQVQREPFTQALGQQRCAHEIDQQTEAMQLPQPAFQRTPCLRLGFVKRQQRSRWCRIGRKRHHQQGHMRRSSARGAD